MSSSYSTWPNNALRGAAGGQIGDPAGDDDLVVERAGDRAGAPVLDVERLEAVRVLVHGDLVERIGQCAQHVGTAPVAFRGRPRPQGEFVAPLADVDAGELAQGGAQPDVPQ